MKKILSLSLALLMLLSCIPLFASCGTKKVDLSAYLVTYTSDGAAYMKRKCTDLSSAMKKAMGKKPEERTVRSTDAQEKIDGFEVLVGKTNRPETYKALDRIDGHGYSVTTSGDKIVLVGTTDLLTSMAVDHFINTYLSSGKIEGELTIKDEVFDELPMFDFTKATAFVCSSSLGSEDKENLYINEFKAKISEISTVKGGMMLSAKDTSEVHESEVIVGATYRRSSVLDVFSLLDADHYGVVVREGTVIVGGLNAAMLEKAKVMFLDMLVASVYSVTTEYDNVKKEIALPVGFSEIHDGEKTEYSFEFPRPEGLSLVGTLDVRDNSMEYLYQSESLDVTAYKNYCATLVNAGYTLYSDHEAEDSIFRTYNNAAAGISLYVSYDAFKHAAEQGVSRTRSLRIVASRLDKVNLIPTEYLSQNLSFTKRQNSSISALRVDYDNNTGDYWGNIYIVTLEDGRFIVLDGGTGTTADVKRIYECLVDLYRRGHGGAAPTTENPIEIAAWYLSHAHGDHFVNMRSFINAYCANYEATPVKIQYLLANFVSVEESHNSNNPASSSTINNILSLSAKVQGGMTYIKLHTGQKFHIANVDLEVMYTHEHLYPTQLHTYNNSSTVIRMTLNHTENGALTGGKETVLWLGDAQESASKVMRAMYGDYLKSDMVQVAHHGYSGCEIALYRLVAPECVWWPAGRTEWKNTYHDSDSTGYRKVSYLINYDIASVKYIILSDDFNYTVSITANGADYASAKSSPTGVFSAGENKDALFSIFSQTPAYGFLMK